MAFDAFYDWMEEVDGACFSLSGISVRDLPDVDFRGMYDDGVSPTEAAECALEAADFSLLDQ